ncbi:MAG: hypothetical protein RL367_2472, partial [Pseudomonadota bacterium]
NGHSTSASRPVRELKRKVACANGTDDREKLCKESIFDVE